MQPRTIAIGDIHGCSAALEARLKAIRPCPQDLIVTLGDYINRGPDSKGVIERLIALANRCRLVPLLGNHDQMLLEAGSGLHTMTWMRMGGIATLQSYGINRGLNRIPDEHTRFLETCLDYYETETHIFVHANYFPHTPMDEQPVTMLRWESITHMTPGPHETGKIVIVGHTSQKSGEILDLGHVKCIDTYCYGGAWLTALDVDTDEIWQADRDGNFRRF
jgi:serine/threonine protein phosphatase 1